MPNHDHADKVCPACGRPVQRCAECNKVFYPNRPDALTCSDICRVHRFRRLAKAKRVAAKTSA